MTTQLLRLFPKSRLGFYEGASWSSRANHLGYGRLSGPATIPHPTAFTCYPVRGETSTGRITGRRSSLRHPFAPFVAGFDECPTGAELNDGETLTINDGIKEVVFEFDSGGGVAPGHVAIPFTALDTQGTVRDAILAAVALSGFQFQIILLGGSPVGTGLLFFGWRSHPGMYGWGARFATTNATMNLRGWGEEFIDQAGRNAYDYNWFPIRWGLKRGWTATRQGPNPATRGGPQ